MTVLVNANQWQNATGAIRQLPAPLIFRALHWLKHEYHLNTYCKKNPIYSLYDETSFAPAKMTAIPTVFSIYDLSLSRYKETQPRDWIKLFEYFIKTRLQHAKHVRTISEFIRQEIIAEFKVSPSMVSAVHLALDPIFRPADASSTKIVRQGYDLPSSYLVNDRNKQNTLIEKGQHHVANLTWKKTVTQTLDGLKMVAN